ncbi:MAG: PEP-CTERM sorting domain-containing protein [Tepidisphaeraceae bacterium]
MTVRTILTLAGLGAMGAAAHAAPALNGVAQVEWGDDTIGYILGTGAGGGGDFDSATQLIGPLSVSASSTDDQNAFTGTATAVANYGAVGVFASGTAPGGNEYLVNVAHGAASFTDTVIVTGGTPGETGTMAFTVHVDGDVTLVHPPPPDDDHLHGVVQSVLVIQDLTPDGVDDQSGNTIDGSFEQYTASQAVDYMFTTTETFSFTYDVPFELSIALSVTSQIGDFLGLGLAGEATGAFGNTVTLTNIEFFENGNPVSASLSAESGTNYLAEVVPEPTGVGVLGIGAVGLLRRRR